MSRRDVVRFNSQALRRYPGEVDELLQYEFFDSATTVPSVITSFGQVLVSGLWKTVSAMQICLSETWKPVTKAQVCVGETWKELA